MSALKTVLGEGLHEPRGSLGCYYRVLGHPIEDCRPDRAKSRKNCLDRFEHLAGAQQAKVADEVSKDPRSLGLQLYSSTPVQMALFSQITG